MHTNKDLFDRMHQGATNTPLSRNVQLASSFAAIPKMPQRGTVSERSYNNSTIYNLFGEEPKSGCLPS